MKATNEELAEVVATLCSVMASVVELNSNIARAVVPVTNQLNQVEKRNLLSEGRLSDYSPR